MAMPATLDDVCKWAYEFSSWVQYTFDQNAREQDTLRQDVQQLHIQLNQSNDVTDKDTPPKKVEVSRVE
jgi:membrane-bound lytic murein transglycosylase B